jgi:putative spermidine/putrescine transport system permease protein
VLVAYNLLFTANFVSLGTFNANLTQVATIVIVAVGVYFAFAPLGLTDGYAGLILAHTTLAVPFVVVTVLATLAGFDRTLLRASASLGAPPWTTFRRVTLPLILPGVLSGAVFAFAASFDEVVVALLIAGPGQRTLPRQMFADILSLITRLRAPPAPA